MIALVASVVPWMNPPTRSMGQAASWSTASTLASAPSAGLAGVVGVFLVVGVALDTVRQIESQLVMRHYDGFTGRGGRRVRGRR